MIMTDGNPCVPDELGSCPYVICQYQSALLRANIKAVIIGIGDGLQSKYVRCIVESDNYFIPFSDFTYDDFESILCNDIDFSKISTFGVTNVNINSIWTDDFIFAGNNSVGNTVNGRNWYPLNAALSAFLIIGV